MAPEIRMCSHCTSQIIGAAKPTIRGKGWLCFEHVGCWDRYAQLAIECTCPDYWFPEQRREALRKLPHGNGLAHHSECARLQDHRE